MIEPSQLRENSYHDEIALQAHLAKVSKIVPNPVVAETNFVVDLDTVQVGSQVTFTKDGECMQAILVPNVLVDRHPDATPIACPLGRILMGKSLGPLGTLSLNGKTTNITVLSIVLPDAPTCSALGIVVTHVPKPPKYFVPLTLQEAYHWIDKNYPERTVMKRAGLKAAFAKRWNPVQQLRDHIDQLKSIVGVSASAITQLESDYQALKLKLTLIK